MWWLRRAVATSKNEYDIISVFIFDYISQRRQNVLKKKRKERKLKICKGLSISAFLASSAFNVRR